MTTYREKTGEKVYGTLGGEWAYMLDGVVYLVVGRDNGWVKVRNRSGEFQPYSQADANEPKNRTGLGIVGHGKVDRYWGAR